MEQESFKKKGYTETFNSSLKTEIANTLGQLDILTFLLVPFNTMNVSLRVSIVSRAIKT